MRLTFGPEVESFREEFLAWLAENRPWSVEQPKHRVRRGRGKKS